MNFFFLMCVGVDVRVFLVLPCLRHTLTTPPERSVNLHVGCGAPKALRHVAMLRLGAFVINTVLKLF